MAKSPKPLLVAHLGRKSPLAGRLLPLLASDATLAARRYLHLIALLAAPHQPCSPLEALEKAGIATSDAMLPAAAKSLREALHALPLAQAAREGDDLFAPLWESILSPLQRRRAGQHFTPPWLADFVLEQAGIEGDSSPSMVDPSCGSGVFLLRAARWLRARGLTSAEISSRLAGCEVDPVTAALARTNLALALDGAPDAMPIYQVDLLIAPVEQLPSRPFDMVIGNPPWVRWNLLEPEYRQATLSLWEHYGLFSLKGYAAQLGGGEKDLSMLFVYRAADKLLRDGGRLSMVVPLELLRSRGAGEGFRRFRLGRDGAELCVERVDDMMAVRPFLTAVNKTAVLTLRKGAPTRYPAPYHAWKPKGARLERPDSRAAMEVCFAREERQAQPVGPHATSAWMALPLGEAGQRLERLVGPGTYKARRGASADPYGVFLVEPLATHEDGTVSVRNLFDVGKRAMPRHEQRVEARYLFPAVRGGDLRAWVCKPGCAILLPQDPATRMAVSRDELRDAAPLTLAYFERFRDALAGRRSNVVKRLASSSMFYATIGVGEYTFAPYRVLWSRMANDLRAVVVSQIETPWGMRPPVGIDTISYVPLDGESEAHYLCGLFNSDPVREVVRAMSSAGRGFGSPVLLERLALPRYCAGDDMHRELADMARAAAENPSGLDAARLNEIVLTLLDRPASNRDAMAEPMLWD